VSAEVRHIAAPIFGGSYNSLTGEFSFDDPNKSRDVARTIAVAERLIREGHVKGAAQAVAVATELFNRTSSSGQQTQATDDPTPKSIQLPAVSDPEIAMSSEERKEAIRQNNDIDQTLSLFLREIGVDMKPVLSGTGPVSKATAALEGTLGAVATALGRDEPLFPETAEGRSKLRNFAQSAKRAIINNPRFPVEEQKFVADLAANPDTFFVNPQEQRVKMQQLIEHITAVRRGSAEQLAGRSAAPLTPLTVQSKSFEELQAVATKMSREDWEALPVETREAIISRLNSRPSGAR